MLRSVKTLSGPLKAGLIAAAIGIIFAIIGMARGIVPLRFASIFMAMLISGGSWGIVVWVIATAVADVEHDLADDTQNEA